MLYLEYARYGCKRILLFFRHPGQLLLFRNVILLLLLLFFDPGTQFPRNENTHTHTFNGPSSWTTRVSQYQKGKTNLDFTEARDREWQWHQLGHMQVCT